MKRHLRQIIKQCEWFNKFEKLKMASQVGAKKGNLQLPYGHLANKYGAGVYYLLGVELFCLQVSHKFLKGSKISNKYIYFSTQEV